MSVKVSKYLEVCRFCLKHVEDFNRIKISEIIKTKFEAITGSSIKFSESFPDFHCYECLEELETCFSIKEKFVKNQLILECDEKDIEESFNNDLMEFKVEYLEADVKTEYYNDEIDETLPEKNNVEVNSLEYLEESTSISIIPTPPSQKLERQSLKVKCPDCGISIRKDVLKRHQDRVHLNLREHKCSLCSKNFHTKRKLDDHIKSHLKIKDVTCETCNMKFSSKGTLLAHKKSVHEKRYARNCEYCNKSFSTKTYYDNHIQSKHIGERIYSCDFKDCDKSFFTTADLAKHKKTSHENPVQCSVCFKDFNSAKSLNRHVKTHQVPQNELKRPLVPCPICKKMVRKDSMKRHHDRIHLNLKLHWCDVCGKGYYMKSRILDHVKSHFGVKDIECKECGMKFSSKGTLMAHRNIIHENRYARTCEYCGQVFPNKNYYETHIRSKHTKERTFTCSLEGCGKSYFSKADLTKHQKIGHVETSVNCPICFKTVKSIKKHMKYHDDRKFVCDFMDNGEVCDKKFVNSFDLKKHINVIHRGIRDYLCSHCDMCYSNSSDLGNHIRNIHQKRKIKCELCSSLLGAKEYYRKHILAHHKELDEKSRDLLVQKIRSTKEEDLFNYQK